MNTPKVNRNFTIDQTALLKVRALFPLYLLVGVDRVVKSETNPTKGLGDSAAIVYPLNRVLV